MFFDLTIVLLYPLIIKLFNLSLSNLTSKASILLTGILLIIINIFLPFYLNDVYQNYKNNFAEKNYGKLIYYIFGFFKTITSLIVSLVIPMYFIIAINEIAIGTVVLIIGVISIVISSFAKTEPNYNSSGLSNLSLFIMIIASAITIFLGIGYGVHFFTKGKIIQGILLLFVIFIGPLLSYYLAMGFNKAMKFYIFRNILMPVIISFLLIFYHTIFFNVFINIEYMTKTNILISLIISGVIPVRLYILFCPPIKLINLIMGLAGFISYIYFIF